MKTAGSRKSWDGKMKADRKIIFNLYEEQPRNKGKREITTNIITKVAEEIPFNGVIIMTLSDGSKIAASRHDYVKNDTYDIYWTDHRKE